MNKTDLVKIANSMNAVKNAAGGNAYNPSTEHLLAQYCMTGCLKDKYYSTSEDQLTEVVKMANAVSPEYLARLAVYTRQNGFMKDMPAVLLAVLSTRNPILFKRVAHRVMDNLKMVRNFVNVMRSGVVGRKSLGTAPKKAIARYLIETPILKLFQESAGNDPSIGDIIKMVHPKPKDNGQKAFFAYLIGKEYVKDDLDTEILKYEDFKRNPVGHPPEVNFQFLSNLKLTQDQWRIVARNMSWHTLRMNLNTLERHGILTDMAQELGKKIADKDVIVRAKVFPFQIFNTIRNVTNPVMADSLRMALDMSLSNIKAFNGTTAVFVDISGSMHSPVMGQVNYTRNSAPVLCSETAALFAAAIKRANPSNVEVVPFHTQVVTNEWIKKINSGTHDVYEMTKLIAASGAGGTDCAAGIRYLLSNKRKVDNIVIISDNMSWYMNYNPSGETATDATYRTYLKEINPEAKLVCLDLAPGNIQVKDSVNVMNIGGFNDSVFEQINRFFANGKVEWSKVVNSIEL